MKKLIAAGVLALASISGVAQAAPTPSISFNTSATATNPMGSTIINTFDGTGQTSGTLIGFNSFITSGSTGGVSVQPAVFSTGNYAEAGTNGSFSLAFGPTNLLSFAIGSLDAFNSLTLLFSDASTVTLAGGNIINDANFMTDGRRDGVVTYTVTGNQLLTGATFASGQQAFEIDNVAVGVPEPAAWGMMILGFGLVGGVLRRRSTAKVKFA